MNKIYNLALANLRKGKGQATSLLIFIIIAAILLNLGLLLMLRFGDFYDKKSEETHAAHYSLVLDKAFNDSSGGKLAQYIRDYKGVIETEISEVIVFLGDIFYNGGKMPIRFILSDAEAPIQMNPLTIIEGSAPKLYNDICLPYLYKAGGGYEIGDTFKIETRGNSFTYKITGFTEQVLFGAISDPNHQFYVSRAGFDELAKQSLSIRCVMISARLNETNDCDKLSIDLMKYLNEKIIPKATENLNVYNIFVTYSTAKMARISMSEITALILVVFAALIVIINLIVIRFRIRNTIEESITNIGALKAMGYTSTQIVGGINLQFGIITVLGTALGITVSYLALPAVSGVLVQQTALNWVQGFDPVTSLITMLALVLSVLFITFLSAGRIRTLDPLIALRQGLSTHNFKRNHLLLDRSKGSLPLLMALKSALQNKGQIIMVFSIIFAVSFTATAGVAIYDNIGLHPESFARLIIGEMPDCGFFVADSKNAPIVMERIRNNKEVRKAFYYDQVDVFIDDVTICSIITDDFSELEGSLLYQGRYPKHDNEIAISAKFADYDKKNIGDVISVKYSDKTEDYIVVGLIQTVNYEGLVCTITAEGIKRLSPAFERFCIYAYVNNSENIADFIKKIEETAGPVFESIVNINDYLDAQLDMYSSIFRAMAVAIVVVTLLVIMLVLYLMLKTLIIRQRRTLGIQKALGFTTWQLMNQMSLNFVPIIVLGIAAGGIAGVLGFNSIFVALLKSSGIMTASMPSPLGMTIIMCGGLIFVSYAISMLISWRIRKINAYALMSE